MPGDVRPTDQQEAGPAWPSEAERDRLNVKAPLRAEDGDDGGKGLATRIAGLSILKGLVLYGATLTFAGFYGYFIAEIVTAADGEPPTFNGAMVAAAAALAGILGSAFALVVGVRTDVTNEGLERALEDPALKKEKKTRLRRLLSLEPGGPDKASWPLTFGIWLYALVASAVAIVYLVNQAETPEAIKALAVAFAGYVIAFMTAAYGLASRQ
jgi:hypothetical protein